MLARTVPAPERRRTLRVLVVDSSVDDARRVRELLASRDDFATFVARSSDEAALLLADGLFDVALVDYAVWTEPQTQLVRLMREEHADVAVVLLTSGENDRETLPALKLGAHDFLSKQHLEDVEQLATRILAAFDETRALRRRETMVRWLEREARTDHLTGLYNRRAFDDRLRELCEAGKRANEPVTLIVVDVAGTRTVNDIHGHEAGDDMIRRAGAAIARCIRSCDFAARIGGDDFGVILPGCDMELGRLIARRISHEAERLNGEECEGRVPVALTFGVATGRNCDSGALFTAADQQLSDYKSVRPVIAVLHRKDDSDGPYVA